MEQQIRFCKTSDGVRIAYATVGSDPALVIAPGLFSHLQASWENEQLRRVWETYARDFTVIRYDKRGTGLSDRSEDDYSLDARLRDLEAVVEDLHLVNFYLRGQSEGGPVAIAYAARHPERVLKLVLSGTFASGPQLAELRRDVGEALTALIKAEWNLGSRAISDLLGTEPPQGFPTGMRERATSAEYFDAMIRAMAEIDVTDLLPAIIAPTLIVHGRDDKAIPFELGRALAAAIPNARLYPFEGGHNPSDAKGIAELIQTIRSFMLDLPSDAAVQTPDASALRTVLFTDLTSSTALTQRLGDAKAQELVRAHNTIVREALAAQGGTEIKHTGDGIMASFPTASGALECAVAIQRDVALQGESDLAVHIGLNAGEPVAEERDLFGTSVQLARRICDHAQAGQILASNVVRELAAGKGFLFSDMGEVVPKGFEEPVRLYEVRWREDT
jgi:pimeloyl-ACP methyl ester carboxylesterase/class 3 adenylate cyclase